MAADAAIVRRSLFAAGVIAVAGLAAAGALYMRVTGNDAVVLPDTTTYTEGVAGTWQRINPIYASSNRVDADLSALVFSGLTRIGPSGRVLPDLAEELPEITDGGRTYTFRLRDGVRWHDGEPLTSADVAFTIARVIDPSFRGDPLLAEAWSSVEVSTPDERTVVFRLPDPSAPFLARYTTLGILPRHLLSGLSAEELYQASFNAAPVGSGPYRLESLDSERAVLRSYSRYHLGAPAISSITLHFFSDYAAGLRALRAEEIDGLMIRESLTATQIAEVEQLDGVTVEHPQRGAFLVMYLNNDQAAYFQDPRVRRAIALAVDRRAIVEEVFGGNATASGAPIPPGTWAYDATFDDIERRVEEAATLLDEAGWTAHATTGIRVKEGAEFRITIRTDNDPLRVAVAGAIAEQLEAVGIRANVASTTFSVLRRDFLRERRYEAAIAGWDQGPDPDPYFGWHSSQMGSAGLNIANFADAVADSLIEEGRTSSDWDERADMYRQFQEVWQDLAPSVVIAYPRYTYIHPDGLDAVLPGVLFAPAQRFFDVHKWRF